MNIFTNPNNNITPLGLAFCVALAAMALYVALVPPPSHQALAQVQPLTPDKQQAEADLPPLIGISNLSVGEYFVISVEDQGAAAPDGLTHKFVSTVSVKSDITKKPVYRVISIEPNDDHSPRPGRTWKVAAPGVVGTKE